MDTPQVLDGLAQDCHISYQKLG